MNSNTFPLVRMRSGKVICMTVRNTPQNNDYRIQTPILVVWAAYDIQTTYLQFRFKGFLTIIP